MNGSLYKLTPYIGTKHTYKTPCIFAPKMAGGKVGGNADMEKKGEVVQVRED